MLLVEENLAYICVQGQFCSVVSNFFLTVTVVYVTFLAQIEKCAKYIEMAEILALIGF